MQSDSLVVPTQVFWEAMHEYTPLYPIILASTIGNPMDVHLSVTKVVSAITSSYAGKEFMITILRIQTSFVFSLLQHLPPPPDSLQ